jgi:hypothetical protein
MARDFSKFSVEGLKSAINKPESDSNTGSYSRDDWYNFWDIPTGSRVVIRLLPDLNEDNAKGFTIDRMSHKLTINGENKTIPCLKNYGDDCPICKVSAQYYKQEGKGSVNGKKYWRKMSHICRALIVEDPMPPNPETGVNATGTIKNISFSWQVWMLIMEGIDSGDVKLPPFFYQGGTDFIIKKTEKGDYPDYSIGTRYAGTPSDLTPEQIEFVEAHLVDLSTLLPAKPPLEKVEAMLQAALTGAAYQDGEAPEDHIPDADDATTKAVTSKPAAAAPAPVSQPASDETDAEADEILANIRKRRAAKAQADA